MLKIKHLNTMNQCLFKAKDTKGQWAIRWIIHRLPLLNLLTLVHG